MTTSLEAIAKKAASDKKHRFQNMYGMLNEAYLLDCWRGLNKQSAVGVDGVSARAYEENLEANVRDLVERLKQKRYRAPLVRRHYIPKEPGKMRPLGIPATEDKLLQLGAARILQAIWEEDFLASSFGYRPGVGARESVKSLTVNLQMGPCRVVVEADIKGFFDHLDHDWLIRMLQQRIDDQAFLRLIEKWLKAGILDTNGMVIDPPTGSPQGGIVSPVLANIYLHYALDLWFYRVFQKSCQGKALLCRYADDFVCAFEQPEDADRFHLAVKERLEQFGLETAAEKTKVIQFGGKGTEGGEPFDFLGFEFRWAKTRSGKRYIRRRTSRKRLRRALLAFTAWIKKWRWMNLKRLIGALNRKLQGHYNYYGVLGNYDGIYLFYWVLKRLMFKWLNRRSQRSSYTIEGFKQMLESYKLAPPRVTEKHGIPVTDLSYPRRVSM
jgi:group II intron reverse transcriptase/maturase